MKIIILSLIFKNSILKAAIRSLAITSRSTVWKPPPKSYPVCFKNHFKPSKRRSILSSLTY